MKSPIRWLFPSLVTLMLGLACCSDPADEDLTSSEDDENKVTTPEGADAQLASFSFTSSTKVTGSVPTVVNSSLVKTNAGDTLYVLAGVPNMLRLSHPPSRPASGVFITVKGATYYYDVPIDDKEDSDSVSTIVYEVDPEEVAETGNNVQTQVTVYDENKQPIDIIERIVLVEKPDNRTSGCDITQPGDTTFSQTIYGGWRWESTILYGYDGKPLSMHAPGRIYKIEQQHSGCCDESACPALVVNPQTQILEWVYDSEFEVRVTYSISWEHFFFYNNGRFHRITHETQTNVNAEYTDWCNGIPAIDQTHDVVHYYGTHDYEPGDTRISYGTTRARCKDPLGLCGYGSRGGDLTIGCDTMVITAGVEGQKEVRTYRKFGDVIADGEAPTLRWKD